MPDQPETRACAVCGDEAGGVYYGAYSCHGCKGFFRRTVSLQLSYHCRFSLNCVVAKHTRNVCRFCRYAKCIAVGMKTEAANKELEAGHKQCHHNHQHKHHPRNSHSETSDPYIEPDHCALERHFGISKTREGEVTICRAVPVPDNLHPDGKPCHMARALITRYNYTTVTSFLVRAERECKQIRDSFAAAGTVSTTFTAGTTMLGDTCDKITINGEELLFASIGDLCNLSRTQLLAVICVLKRIPSFGQDLPPHDQAAILRGNGAEFLLLACAYRSIAYQNTLLLSDNCHVLSRNPAKIPYAARIVDRILDELVEPMRRMTVDEEEYCLLRLLAFWNPDLLSQHSQALARANLNLFKTALEYYECDHHPNEVGRLSGILLLLVNVKSIAEEIRDCYQLGNTFGVLQADPLLDEIFADRNIANLTSTLIETSLLFQLKTTTPTCDTFDFTVAHHHNNGVETIDADTFIAAVP